MRLHTCFTLSNQCAKVNSISKHTQREREEKEKEKEKEKERERESSFMATCCTSVMYHPLAANLTSPTCDVPKAQEKAEFQMDCNG